MKDSRIALAACFALMLTNPARAADVSLHGYVDCRLIARADERSFSDGGLGKTRFGGGGGDATCVQGALAISAVVTPALIAQAQIQYQTTDRNSLSLLEAYLRYRPVSTTPLRWSMKVGAFFPPVSLENDAIGWTSPWTLTSSAINAWIGEEFRSIGAEGRVEWRGDNATIAGLAALVRSNDPAGELLAARGWSLSDMVSGIGTRVREPDADVSDGGAPPYRFNPFIENDGRLGWYAGASWEARGIGKLSLLRYDNDADPSSHSNGREPVWSWKTDFWSLGGETRIGDVVLLGQAMVGSTAFSPTPTFHTSTEFSAAYVLAGWDRGAWRPTLRVDVFSTTQQPQSLTDRTREHGNAITLALNWRPCSWLRLTGEALRVHSWRNEREEEGIAASQTDTQLQLSARVIF